ncbi:DNA helicase [Microbacterium sp. BK668]|uniref:DNA helicase n=1 Tax=Microbacterium sp. BK668 TaxID=2512118 RepID=UPI001060E91B|nr:DNA helicase [Microbacterium sp. BK668]TDN91037.1 hypothetical protein EV279_0532 [Microbacterium sp. BK668]
MSLSRKRKKELRKLQNQANRLWESQQVLVGEAASVAREARRQLGNYRREQLVPQARQTYGKFAAPYVDKGVSVSRQVLNDRVVPAAGAVVGSAMSVWDAASEQRDRLATGRGLDLSGYGKKLDQYGSAVTKKLSQRVAPAPPPRKGIGAGGVIAIIFGVAAAIGVAYAAWQTLRADDELWVADDPLRAPDA